MLEPRTEVVGTLRNVDFPSYIFCCRALMGNVNYFGNGGSIGHKYIKKLMQIEQENTDAMIVFMSDVWLDKIKVSVCDLN